MLPSAHRMRRREDFAVTSRRGRRAARPTLVVHVLAPGDPSVAEPCRIGFVVGRTVGGSVLRHRVVRRLRALTAARLDRLPPGGRLVVRALPPAGSASSAVLGADLDAALGRALTSGPS